MAALDQYEVKRSRRYRESRAGFAGRLIYMLPAALATPLVRQRGAPWPDSAGAQFGPVLFDYDLDLDFDPPRQLARYVEWYRTPTVEEFLELNAPKGVAMTTGSISIERVKRWNGLTIEGPDPDDLTGRTVWVVTGGKNVAYHPRGVARVMAVVTKPAVWRDQWLPQLGKYNKTYMTAFGNAALALGKCLFYSMQFSPRMAVGLDGSKLYTARYDFLIHENTWKEDVTSLAHESRVVETEVLDVNGDPIEGETQMVATLVPTDRYRVSTLVEGANFSPINSLCLGSW